jgi:hypothetical protein
MLLSLFPPPPKTFKQGIAPLLLGGTVCGLPPTPKDLVSGGAALLWLIRGTLGVLGMEETTHVVIEPSMAQGPPC